VSREEAIKVEGRVVEVLPNSIYRVELPNGHRILAHVSGKMRLNFVRIASGDKVTVEMSPYDLSKGCIAFKEK
jgi:translation initiation factor IF-1